MSGVEVVSFGIHTRPEVISSWSWTAVGNEERVLIPSPRPDGEGAPFPTHHRCQLVRAWSRDVLLVCL